MFRQAGSHTVSARASGRAKDGFGSLFWQSRCQFGRLRNQFLTEPRTRWRSPNPRSNRLPGRAAARARAYRNLVPRCKTQATLTTRNSSFRAKLKVSSQRAGRTGPGRPGVLSLDAASPFTVTQPGRLSLSDSVTAGLTDSDRGSPWHGSSAFAGGASSQ